MVKPGPLDDHFPLQTGHVVVHFHDFRKCKTSITPAIGTSHDLPRSGCPDETSAAAQLAVTAGLHRSVAIISVAQRAGSGAEPVRGADMRCFVRQAEHLLEDG